MRVGDCFDDSSSSSDEISGVAGVPCAQAHDNEIYAIYNVTESEYPSDEVMGEIAWEGCYDRFESFVGRDYESSQLDIFPMYPSKDSWRLKDDREVICAVYDMDLAKLNGTAADLGL